MVASGSYVLTRGALPAVGVGSFGLVVGSSVAVIGLPDCSTLTLSIRNALLASPLPPVTVPASLAIDPAMAEIVAAPFGVTTTPSKTFLSNNVDDVVVSPRYAAV